MKKNLTVFFVLFSLFIDACIPNDTRLGPLNGGSESLPTDSLSPTESAQQPVPEVSTTLPNAPITLNPETDNVTLTSQSASPDEIKFTDNGRTFSYHVGDSFLLDLGTDIYEWTAAVDNQDVVALKTGETPPAGTQGFFTALSSGTANLTAVGDPLCRKVSPPCGVPTILFKVTLTVE